MHVKSVIWILTWLLDEVFQLRTPLRTPVTWWNDMLWWIMGVCSCNTSSTSKFISLFWPASSHQQPRLTNPIFWFLGILDAIYLDLAVLSWFTLKVKSGPSTSSSSSHSSPLPPSLFPTPPPPSSSFYFSQPPLPPPNPLLLLNSRSISPPPLYFLLSTSYTSHHSPLPPPFSVCGIPYLLGFPFSQSS